jgi:hypothetical protein
MTRLLIVGSLWKGRCYFGMSDLQLEEGTRDTSVIRIRTVFECSDHRNERCIERITIIVDTCRIDV